MNIARVLAEQAVRRADRTALIDRRDRHTSYAELERLASLAAAALADAGLRRGDTVIVLVPMSAELYATLGGIWKIGAVAMLVDPSARESRLAACCRSAPPRAIVLSAKAHLLLVRSATLRSIGPRFSTVAGIPGSRSLFRERGTSRADHPAVTLRADSLALVTFTSGSTGQPKAAGRTHGLLLAQHAALSRTLRLAAGQVDLTTLPVFVLTNLGNGVTSVVPDADLRRVGALDPVPVLRQIRRLGITRTVASPAMLLRLVEECERSGSDLAGMRAIYTGGGPVFPSLLRRLRSLAPAARIVGLYGSTEAEPIADQLWDDVTAADLARTREGEGLLAGRPVPEAHVRTVELTWGEPAGPFTPTEFDALASRPGTVGEIVVTGEHVLKGYLDARGDGETKIAVGADVWHRTGDLGRFDETGRLWLLGRAGTAAAGLYALGIEAALDGTPGLVRCALAADPSGRPLLAVQSDGTLDLASLDARTRCLGIATIRVVAEIPVDPRHNAKVDYVRLNALLAE